jgi:hypothetical protein
MKGAECSEALKCNEAVMSEALKSPPAAVTMTTELQDV